MASSDKTTHLRLSYWSGADSPKMSDFNENNRKLDEFAGSVPTREQLRPSLIYPALCRYQEGIFYLSELPESLPESFTVRFTAPASYTKGEIFSLGGHRMIPCMYDFTPLPDAAFKATAIIAFEADPEGGRAFFRPGGAVADREGGQEEQPPAPAAYNIFFGEAPPEDAPDGLFAETMEPVKGVTFTPCMRRKGEIDSRVSFKMPEGRFSFTPFLYGNKIYCIGGRSEASSVFNTVHILDIQTREWSLGTNAPINISDYMLEVIGGKAYLIGGRIANVSYNRVIYSYDMDADQWQEEGNLPSAITSLYYSGSAAANGLIYLLSGTRNGSASTQSYVLDPETCLMTELAANTNGTTWAKAVEKDGIIYVLGRNATLSSNKAGVMAYHIESNLWTILYSDPQNRTYMGVCLAGSTIYVMGGIRSTTYGVSPMEDIRAYDIESGLWSDLGTMTHRQHSMGLVTGPEGIYCIGGTPSSMSASGNGLAMVDIIWSEDDSYPSGTLAVEYGLPAQNVPLYSARLGRTALADLTFSVRRVFYCDGDRAKEVPFMVNKDGSGWRGPELIG